MKAALIGLGRMGRRHLENLLNLQLDVVGLCDPIEAARLDARAHANLAESCLFADPYKMLAQARPELLIISTTADAHADLTCTAAEHGVSLIMCEKPMATSIAAARRMLDVCARHGARLAINHPMRFMEQYNVPKAMLDSEQFGGLKSVHVAGGNFGIAMNGTHYFEKFRHMTGSPIVEAQAWFSSEKVTNPRGPQFEDRAGALRLVTASGVRLTMDCGSDQGHGCRVIYTARNGQIFVDELGGKAYWTARKAEHREMPTTRYGMPWDEGELRIEPADALIPSLRLLNALLAGKEFTTGEDGLAAIRVLVAAHVSAAENSRAVRLDEKLPEDRVFPWA